MNLNEKAQRYLELNKLISSLEKEKEAISKEFKQKGSFQTYDYDIAVSEVESNRVVGLDQLIAALGEETVLNKNLTQKITSTKLNVREKVKASA